jgi:hypothetical protein
VSRRLAAAVMGACGALGVLAGCGIERHQYLGDSRSGLIVQIPDEWSIIEAEDVLDVPVGRTPDSDNVVVSRWLYGFSASSSASAETLFSGAANQPGGVVRSRYLLQHELLDKISVAALLDQVNDLALLPNGTTVTGRSGDGGVVTESGANGVTTVLSAQTPTGTIKVRYVAVVDVVRGQVNTLVIGCSSECYDANEALVEQIAGSFTVMPVQTPPARR